MKTENKKNFTIMFILCICLMVSTLAICLQGYVFKSELPIAEASAEESDFVLVAFTEYFTILDYLYSTVEFTDFNNNTVSQGWNTDILGTTGEYQLPQSSGMDGPWNWYVDATHDFNTIFSADANGTDLVHYTVVPPVYYSSIFISMNADSVYTMEGAYAVADYPAEEYPIVAFADGEDFFIAIAPVSGFELQEEQEVDFTLLAYDVVNNIYTYLYSTVDFLDYYGTSVSEGWNTAVLGTGTSGEYQLGFSSSFGEWNWYVDATHNFDTIFSADANGADLQSNTSYSSIFINMDADSLNTMEGAYALSDYYGSETYPLIGFGDELFIGIIPVSVAVYGNGEENDDEFVLTVYDDGIYQYLYSSVEFTDSYNTFVPQGWNTTLLGSAGEYQLSSATFFSQSGWYADGTYDFNTLFSADANGTDIQANTPYSSIFINMNADAVYEMECTFNALLDFINANPNTTYEFPNIGFLEEITSKSVVFQIMRVSSCE